ncbi:lactate racemase domain-containing protein [Rubinisphaera margarita]|uniref:lactate racemase domain-containing protein n=1 Tax=Rubinisphaera margarita TaxID=2909586 RepID=UPI001EE968A1|nr:lactate racemase domain-containing protein [Rubinisphaera margarita]MCG6156212.1 lactate racemase domain-containing protein [Rubinisphaera margarita]
MPVFPSMYLVARTFPHADLPDIDVDVRQIVGRFCETASLNAGARIGLAVGSRGISEQSRVITAAVAELRERSFEPVLIPAMGSHGGATAEGQMGVLDTLGIGPGALGVPCSATIKTVVLGETSTGVPVHVSAAVSEVDGLILCNRIKPHTRFTGEVQSGLLKMLTIGLGKHVGAATYHEAAVAVPFAELIREAVEIVLAGVPCLGGLALIENQRKQLAEIHGLSAGEFISREPVLLQRASELVARLPVTAVDLLVVDEIGKEISGTGMDTNVIGRKYNDHVSGPDDWCQTSLIYVRGLTDGTQGNANGIGVAEFTRRAALERIDWSKTTVNAMTARHPTSAMCPVVFENDREVFEAALGMCSREPRIVHIRNTGSLERVYLSEACLGDARQSEFKCGVSIRPDYYECVFAGGSLFENLCQEDSGKFSD